MTRFLGTFILLFCFLATVQAEPVEETPWYQVELIIFEHTDISKTNTETWPDDPGAPEMSQAVDLIPLEVLDDYLALTQPPEPVSEPITTDLPLTPQGDISETPIGDSIQSNQDAVAAPAIVDAPNSTLTAQPTVSLIPEEQPFVLLPVEDLTLQAAVSDLTRAKQYQVLHHIAWRQPVFPANKSLATHIHSNMEVGENLLNKVQASIAQQQATIEANAEMDELVSSIGDESVAIEGGGETTQTMGIEINQPIELTPVDGSFDLVDTNLNKLNATQDESSQTDLKSSPLEGLIRISLSRYLHLSADLTYSREVSVPAKPLIFKAPMQQNEDDLIHVRENPHESFLSNLSNELNASPTTLIKPFRLIESRRMRSKEVHYIDHPAFGILALITPYERQLPSDEGDTAIENIMIGVMP